MNSRTIIHTSQSNGWKKYTVEIESSSKRGLPKFQILGLPGTTIKESMERIRSGIESSYFSFPKGGLTVSLSPVDLKKDGTHFDLPIALSILSNSDQWNPPKSWGKIIAFGGIGLDGTIKKIPNPNVYLTGLEIENFQTVILPIENREEISSNWNYSYIFIDHLNDLFPENYPEPIQIMESKELKEEESLNDIYVTEEQLKSIRALQIALSGNHHLIFFGSPGVGKSFFSRLSKDLMPPLTKLESSELIQGMVYQSKFENHLSFKRPFRDPHHTSTINSIVGGGSPIKVGEISLSHNGILFMDEFAEFPTAVIQALREPMDSGFIRINRVNDSILVPAKFTLIATTNLCPCGYFDDDETICTCHPTKIRTYLSKFSGPILERIDISVKIKRSNTNSKKLKIDLNSLKKSITAAREIKEIEYDDIMNYKIGVDCLNQISKVYRPSHRKINKINTLVNTICKLAGEKTWREEYILEAIQYDELTSRIRSI